MKFEKWICPEDSEIDNDTSRVLQIVYDCSNIRDLNLTAKYTVVKQDTVEITNNLSSLGDVTVNVYSPDGTNLGGIGTYYIDALPDEYLRVEVLTGENKKFQNWLSNVPSYNLVNTPELIIKSQIGISKINTDIGIIASSSDYSITIIGKFADNVGSRYDNSHKIEEYLDLSPDANQFDTPNGMWKKKVITNSQPFGQQITAEIIQDNCECYKIYSVTGDVVSPFEHNYASAYKGPTVPSWSEYVEVDNDNRHKTVIISVDRKLVYLEMELVAESNKDLPSTSNGARIELIPNFPPNNTDAHILGRLEQSYRTDKIEYHRYAIKCHQNVDIAVRYDEEEVSFKEYQSGLGYYSGANPTVPIMQIHPVCESYDISHGKKIRGVLTDEFKITHFGFFTYYSGVTTYIKNTITNIKTAEYNYLASGNVDPDSTFQLSPNDNLVILDFYFNQDVDVNTINNVYNLYIKDESERIDWPRLNNPKFYYSPHSVSSNFEWLNARTIRCTLQIGTGNVIKIPKFQEFSVLWSAGIKNTSGAPLTNPHKVHLLTEYPTFSLEPLSLKSKSDPDGLEWWDREYKAYYFISQYSLDNPRGLLTEPSKHEVKAHSQPDFESLIYYRWNHFNEWRSVVGAYTWLKIASHKRADSYRVLFGGVWFECDNGRINSARTEIIQKLLYNYENELEGMHDTRLRLGVENTTSPYRKDIFGKMSDDPVGSFPDKSYKNFDMNTWGLGYYNRWNTFRSYNQVNDVIEIDNQYIGFKMRYILY